MSTVTVLMSTYNGEKYLTEQIESVLKQKNIDVSILVRDDGSTDATKKLLDEYKKKGILSWYTGENLRSAQSFMDLVNNAPDTDYYAFCDQDDVWNENKLFTAVQRLKELDSKDVPLLYCGNYQLVDAYLKMLPDNGHASTTTFAAALVSSCCTGCTTVFNKTLLNYLIRKTPKVMVMHDDWVHKVCLAVGGVVVYDEKKVLLYRQHGNNVDGGVHGVRSKISNIRKRIISKDCIRSHQIQEIIDIFYEDMPMHNLDMAKRVARYRELSLFSRIKLAFDKEICTPYRRLNRGYRLAIILKYY